VFRSDEKLSIRLSLLVLVAGCHKNDVDIAELDTNTFDADHPGVTAFITVDTVVTQSYGQGTLYKQLVTLQVHPELFRRQVLISWPPLSLPSRTQLFFILQTHRAISSFCRIIW
jgi:hypothetical protein